MMNTSAHVSEIRAVGHHAAFLSPHLIVQTLLPDVTKAS
jgi:hypothetical protein